MKPKYTVSDTQQRTRPPHTAESVTPLVTRAPQAFPPSAIRVIRFRLSPYRSSDQRILDWLANFPPYYRAGAIRTVLFEHVRRLAAADEEADTRRNNGGNSHAQPDQGPAPPARQSGPSTTAEKKLKSLFS